MREATDLFSPEVLTATFQEDFKDAQREETGINMDGQTMSDLNFADDVALEVVESMEKIKHRKCRKSIDLS